MQTVGIDLSPGEVIYSQTATMAWMTDGVRMNTRRRPAGRPAAQPDLAAVLHHRVQQSRGGHIGTSAAFPPARSWPASWPRQSLICRKETFLYAEKSVSIEMAWQQRIGAEAQLRRASKVTGPGVVFLDLHIRKVVTKQQGAGEKPAGPPAGRSAMQADRFVRYPDAAGLLNIIFGGEGLFVATLTEAGRGAPQSMPILNLAEEIARYLPGGHNNSANASNIAGAAAATGAIPGQHLWRRRLAARWIARLACSW